MITLFVVETVIFVLIYYSVSVLFLVLIIFLVKQSIANPPTGHIDVYGVV